MKKVKKCIVCGETITGRTDKKYCSDSCRSYNNNAIRRNKMQKIKGLESINIIHRDIIELGMRDSIWHLRFLVTICKILKKFSVRKDRINK